MARAAPLPPTDATGADLPLPFADWFESQQRLAAVAMSQWTGLQELWLRGMNQQLDAWRAWWPAPDTAAEAGPTAWGEVPAAWTTAMQRATAAWWGPWLPVVARGGEQLG